MGIQNITQILIGSYVICSRIYYLMITILLLPYYPVLTFQAPAVIPNLPFIMGWNAPTEFCTEKFKLPLDLSLFSFVGSTVKKATNQNITMFYTDRLGYYPYINEKTGKIYNEGIPQLASLEKHLAKAKQDIDYYIPEDKFGLAIIDWEEWRPNWVRNWKPKTIYQIHSMELAHQQNIKLSRTEAWKVAKNDFEKAAKTFMQETLKLGKSLRPNHLWGYYLFPDCHNYNYKKPQYNGSCYDIEIKRNNELNWLWKESTALFPSIYLSKTLKNTQKAHIFVRSRIREAIRVSEVVSFKKPLPIFVYVRPVFTDAPYQYLSEADLVNTIGESVALGVSGVIMWGSLNFTQSKKTCTVLDDYIRTTLNPYIINVTLAAKMCSQVLCQEKGVCIRKNWNCSDYLHLNPKRFSIQTRKDQKYMIYGKPKLQDLQEFSEKFHCNCYAGTKCKTKKTVENVQDIKVCIAEDICIEAYLDSNLIDNKFRSPIWRKQANLTLQNFLPLNCLDIEHQQISTPDTNGTDNGDSSYNDNNNIETTINKYTFRVNCSLKGTHADNENGISDATYQQIPDLYKLKPENNLIDTMIYSKSNSLFMNFCTYVLFYFSTCGMVLSVLLFTDM
ncbi:hyaluronidase PH-20 isoform X2 [Sminthopsis crassicaudata]